MSEIKNDLKKRLFKNKNYEYHFLEENELTIVQKFIKEKRGSGTSAFYLLRPLSETKQLIESELIIWMMGELKKND